MEHAGTGMPHVPSCLEPNEGAPGHEGPPRAPAKTHVRAPRAPPMIWQPQADYLLNEIASNLKGVTPVSPTLSITPENWYFVK